MNLAWSLLFARFSDVLGNSDSGLEWTVPLIPDQLGEYQSGQLGQTVNLLSYDFLGSNPSSPTVTVMNASKNDESIHSTFCIRNWSLDNAGVAQLVERQPSKLQVAGSSLVSRSW